MSMPDKLKGMVAGHEDQARKGADKVAQVADEKTGGKYSDQINTVKEKAAEQLGGEQPPAEGEQPNPT
jgi:hypothetical protein